MRFRFITLAIILLSLAACSSRKENLTLFPAAQSEVQLYSLDGREHKVQFKALYETQFTRLEDVHPQSLVYQIKKTTQFLFGPLTHRELGGVQKGEAIKPHLENAFLRNNRVMIPYEYQATWMIASEVSESRLLELPLPYSAESIRSTNWKTCTDQSDNDHSTWSFLWYYWDPSRPGCEHQEKIDYQLVQIQIGSETKQTQLSFPEYKNMIRMENGVPTLAMTFAFGYVKDIANPNPFKDSDFGMREFQKFYRIAKSQLLSLGLEEHSIRQSDITEGSTVIGSQFVGLKSGTQLKVSIVAAAGVDQMDIFSHSYAKKHEGFFAWFGHSRVGSGFDADILEQKLILYPDEFSTSREYQLIYWAGCNSYSYYTLPFFELKSQLNPEQDPQGTRKLDLISNALPSLFAFNAANAQILLKALLNWDSPTSYQAIVDEIENHARSWNYPVIVNVLGDEDNGT